MKRSGIAALLLLLAAAALGAQTILRLRYGGPPSLYHVKNVSAGTPAVVTVWRHTTGQQEHDLANGEVVYLQFVPGCKEANGYRKVINANQAAGTFAITDLNDNPVTCSSPFDPSFESGLAGRVGSFTLRETRPRIFLPGGGELLARSKDPDGPGPRVAPVASENDIPWQRILSSYAGYITPGCDGTTPKLCPNEEKILDAGDSSGTQGWGAFAAAYAWFADNSKTGYLNLARYLLNHVERAMVTNSSGARPGFGFPCDTTARHCSWGSGADWISIGMFNFALAYDMIRDQLTPAEREAFARKMLNGWGGEHDCSNQLQKQNGAANLTQGSKTVTGSGFSAYSPGDGVYFKINPTWGGTGSWGFVVSVASDNEMTVNFISGSSKTAGASKTVEGVDHYKVLPWNSSSCGAAFLAGGHEYNVGAVVRRAATKLLSAITASQTSITVENAGSFPTTVPFYVICESEVMKVIQRSGNVLTVERGQAYSAPDSHSAGKPVVYTSQLQGAAGTGVGPQAFFGFGWENNVSAQKAVGYLLAAFALAGDDPRAAAYAEQVWNYYYDVLYASYLKDYWSGPTQGGLQNQGYHWGRWQGTHWRAGLLGRNAFEEGPIDIMDEYFWRGLITTFLWTPPTKWNWMPVDPASGDAYSNTSLSWTAMAVTLWPGTAASYANYWYRNLSGLLGALTGKNGPQVAAYSPPSAPQTDFRSTLVPWSFHTETDYGPNTYYGILVSKRDWTSSAGMLLAGIGMNWPNDHTIDQGVYVPGSYAIFKGGKLLFGWDNSYGTGGSGSNWFSLAGGSAALKSVAQAPWYSGSQGGQQNQIDRKHGDQRYVYARGNFTLSWKTDAGVLRSHRHFLHIKTDPEYVIVFDDHAMSSAKPANTNLQYFLRYDAQQQFASSEDLRRFVFKKPTGAGAMISTTVLFPDGSNPAAKYSQTSNVHKISFDWGNVTSAQMITVHRVSAGTSDTMPRVEILAEVDRDSYGVEVADPKEPIAILFPRNGADRSSCAFRTRFSGPGQIIVIGLAPGNYRVYHEGNEVAGSPFTVAEGDGTLYIEAQGGSYLLSAVPPAALSVEPLALRFDHQLGGEPPQPQRLTAQCVGGTCAVIVQETCAWLSVEPVSGTTPMVFTVSANPEGLSRGIYSCSILVSAPALNSPQEVVATLVVTDAEEPTENPELEVEPTGATSTRLLVRYGATGLKREDPCIVELKTRSAGERVIEVVEDEGGLARRQVVLGGVVPLEPGTSYDVRVTCGSRSNGVTMQTRARPMETTRTVNFHFRPGPHLPVAQVRLDYGSTPQPGQRVTFPCNEGGCRTRISVAADQVLYFKYAYLDTNARVLAESMVQAITVP
ncbi:MAG: hypothetical protein RMI94_08710 [Bryobacterales bacterium]|nr:hypothetical protein [Bryobacterales bacterium]